MTPSSLKDQLEKARAFDGKMLNKFLQDRWDYDEGFCAGRNETAIARFQHAKDQKLFELLTAVAVAADEHMDGIGKLSKVLFALSALKEHLK